jgi:NMD protein affecting ribosome stability and mRNA decay
MKQFIYIFIASFFLVLAGAVSGKAQTSYEFTYDDSGNRVTRAIISLKSATIPGDTLVARQNEKALEEQIGQRKIKIYPNPTKGQLKVEIPRTGEAPASLRIYSMQGALLQKMAVTDEFTELDLSSQPAGMYILRISIGEQTSEWKILKD